MAKKLRRRELRARRTRTLLVVMRASCELDADDRNAWLFTLANPRFRVSMHVMTMDSPNVRAMFTTKRAFRYVRMLERDFGGYLRLRYGEEVKLEIDTKEMSDVEEIMQTSVDMVVREKHGLTVAARVSTFL